MHNFFVIFTGGTGGHVLPSVSFGNHLIDNGYKCILITDARGKKYTNQFKGKVKIIKASHLTGGLIFKITGLVKLFMGFCQSFLFLLKLKPQIALSFGSYASLPPSIAIKILNKFFKLNFYIHEQNSIIGKSNKYLIKNANKIFVNFDKNYKLENKYRAKIHVVGMPTLKKNIRTNNSNSLLKDNKKFTFFLYGGSQGSIPILKCFEKILTVFTADELKDIYFIIQCPDFYVKNLTKNIKKFNIKYEIKDFYENLSELLENTDLIISRCGAGTINDIIYYQIPSILIPLPSAKDNHQYENAAFLSKQDCGVIMDQDNFDSNKALNFIRLILKDNTKRAQIKEKLNKKIIYDANKLMLDLIKNEISK